MKMNELEQATGVGRETIRFYIRAGLLPEPERPKRNVASYSREHVRRIKTIKSLQKDRRLPLDRIKTVLDAEQNLTEEDPPFAGLANMLASNLSLDLPLGHQKISAVTEKYDLTFDEIKTLSEIELIATHEFDKDTILDVRDVAIVAIWGQLKKAGFSPDKGYGPVDLKRYAEHADAIAKKDVDFFFDRFSGLIDTETAAQVSTQGIELTHQLFGILRSRAVLREIAERTSGLFTEEIE